MHVGVRHAMMAYRCIGESYLIIEQTEPDAAIVGDFWVNEGQRGRGVGRQLLEATCRDADREGVTLYLKPHPFGTYDIETETYHPPGMTHKQLARWYRTFGFRFKPKPFENTMMRTPK